MLFRQRVRGLYGSHSLHSIFSHLPGKFLLLGNLSKEKEEGGEGLSEGEVPRRERRNMFVPSLRQLVALRLGQRLRWPAWSLRSRGESLSVRGGERRAKIESPRPSLRTASLASPTRSSTSATEPAARRRRGRPSVWGCPATSVTACAPRPLHKLLCCPVEPRNLPEANCNRPPRNPFPATPRIKATPKRKIVLSISVQRAAGRHGASRAAHPRPPHPP